ncbi:TetR/AcrR family transcriptional regulator [Cucumibacter marinus]|uniref:TetR/AcrR family transcriptional regulator n=1 Tax=Cucumibacter marinus TaxID=1121252 RepID=UPI000420FA46|nr:TetR/AcrR family transcriptional regulator [Cucumibacter marinus]
MPKAFSEIERNRIEKRLLEVAIEAFGTQGLRATRIADLCQRAGIAKGSFYAFYPSKEALFLALVERQDKKHKRDMLAYFVEGDRDPEARLASFFDLLVDKVETDPLLKLLGTHGEMEYLMRALPEDAVAAHQEADAAFLRRFCDILVEKGFVASADPEALDAILMMLVCLRLQRPMLTDLQYGAAVDLLRDNFVSRLIGANR